MKSEWNEVELSEVADLTVGFVGTMASHYTDKGRRIVNASLSNGLFC